MSCRRAASGAVALLCLLPGCGSGDSRAREAEAVPAPTRRLLANDKNAEVYKKMVGKDGKLLWKPGMPKEAPGPSRR
jgi:hypothetical protein